MNRPTPAAVRGASKPADKCTTAELDAFRADPRPCSSLLLAHMEACAARIREATKQLETMARFSHPTIGAHYLFCAEMMREFANELEGIEP